MKVTIVIGALDRGGSERQVVEFVRAAHPEHAIVNVICLTAEGSLAQEIRNCGAQVTCIGLAGLRMRSALAPLRLVRALRRERPDVVYAFLFWGYTLALPLAAVFSPKSRRVEGRRSLPDADTAQRIFRPLRRVADRLAHGVIANSAAVAAATEAANPRLRGRVHVVSNGVLIPSLMNRTPDTNSPQLICVANLIGYKGHVTLIDALVILVRRGIPFRCLLVGDGPERSTIEGSIAANGLGHVVELLGQREDVPLLLDRSDLAVLPSYTEGLPNAVLEAMAHGLPVVATDVGGVGELIGDDCGLVVAPRQATALADALARLILDPILRTEQGTAGRRRAEADFGVRTMRDSTLAVFRALMTDSRVRADD